VENARMTRARMRTRTETAGGDSRGGQGVPHMHGWII
jgi:hypothetical protein